MLPSSFDELQPAPALDVELLSATAGGGGGYGGDNSSGGYGDYGYSGSPSPSPSPLPSPSPSPLPAPGGNASFPPVPAPDGSTLCTGRAADAICSTKAPVLRGTLLSAGGLSGCEVSQRTRCVRRGLLACAHAHEHLTLNPTCDTHARRASPPAW